MDLLTLYAVVGIVLYGSFDFLPLAAKVTYGFLFPVHWAFISYGRGLLRWERRRPADKKTVLDNPWMFLPIFFFCLWIFLCCG